MDIKLEFSDLLIEQGKLDPLALWRVGDRLITELLPPMTTVVIYRPARYINMYCWILSFLNNQDFKNDKKFWKRFFELESIFLCAIQLHSQHKYSDFLGQIGSMSAAEIIYDKKDGDKIDFTGVKIKNGWEVNYKNPMQQFKTASIDFGFISRLKTTEIGDILAQAYENSISKTDFYKNYRKLQEIPFSVLKQLSEYSCPCLLYDPATNDIQNERDISIKSYLEPIKEIRESETSYLWDSIDLVIDFMKKLKQQNESFNLIKWRTVLSTSLYSNNIEYKPSESLKKVFQNWQMYHLDSLLVYSLESGLSGFLELLHSNNGHIRISDISYNLFEESFNKISKRLKKSNIFVISESVNETISFLKNLDPMKQLNRENHLIDLIRSSSKQEKIIYSFLFYIYVQSLFIKKKETPEIKDALDFYTEFAYQDGQELSLYKCNEQLLEFPNLKDLFINCYLDEWIIRRQLQTRSQREKEVAWFTKSSETMNYEWENNYESNLYRASRINIFMTFLQNMHLVESIGNDWIINDNLI